MLTPARRPNSCLINITSDREDVSRTQEVVVTPGRMRESDRFKRNHRTVNASNAAQLRKFLYRLASFEWLCQLSQSRPSPRGYCARRARGHRAAQRRSLVSAAAATASRRLTSLARSSTIHAAIASEVGEAGDGACRLGGSS